MGGLDKTAPDLAEGGGESARADRGDLHGARRLAGCVAEMGGGRREAGPQIQYPAGVGSALDRSHRLAQAWRHRDAFGDSAARTRRSVGMAGIARLWPGSAQLRRGGKRAK